MSPSALVAAALLALSGAVRADDAPPRSALLGCWRNLDTVGDYSDGRSARMAGRCARFYAQRSIFVACIRPDNTLVETMEYAYELRSPTSYAQHLVTPLAPELAATYVRPNEFTVDGDTLTVVSWPVFSRAPAASSASAPGGSLARMTGHFVRSVPADLPQAACRPDPVR